MNVSQIEIKLSRATTLPVFSKVVKQVLSLSEDMNASARDYEMVIKQDTALTAKIIRTANSAYYNRGAQITTLQRAVTQLGNSTIRSICTAAAFNSSVKYTQKNKNYSPEAFWQHSLAVACTAKLIACLLDQSQAEEAFMAGLMHDIGKLALFMFLPVEAEMVLKNMETHNLSQYEAELEYLGMTHQDIGKLVAEHWDLPSHYVSSIINHHEPPLEIIYEDPLTSYVHVANALVYQIGLGMGPVGEANLVSQEIQDALGLTEAVYDKINHVVANEVARLTLQMGK